MTSFATDYIEGCFPQILEKLTETNLCQTPGYSKDEYCAKARETIRKACNAPDAAVHFLVGGTQTNMIVIDSIVHSYQGVICAASGHINTHETGAVEHTGHKLITLPHTNGKITAQQIDKVMSEHFEDPFREHVVQPAMVYISFPTELGTIYTKNELLGISTICKKWHLPLFIDGARLGYGLCAEGCDVTLEDIACYADVFYIGGTKQGALFGEAIVFTNSTLAPNFRYYMKQQGGLLAKGRLLGIQFETLFSEGLYLKGGKNGVDKAMQIKKALTKKGVKFLVDSPSNQQFPILPNKAVAKLREKFDFEDNIIIDSETTCVRFCTSWATTDKAVAALCKEIGSLEL